MSCVKNKGSYTHLAGCFDNTDLGSSAVESTDCSIELTKRSASVAIGERMREVRCALGFTQSMISKIMGISFQQVQKYEKGFNRVSAASLWDLANGLGISVSDFFPTSEKHSKSSKVKDGRVSFDFDFDGKGGRSMKSITNKDSSQLLNYFEKIEDPKIRKKVVGLVSSISGVQQRQRMD